MRPKGRFGVRARSAAFPLANAVESANLSTLLTLCRATANGSKNLVSHRDARESWIYIVEMSILQHA
jgi:hypothetical protein